MAAKRNTGDGIGPRSHEDTWGASAPAKDKWTRRNADGVRRAVEADNEKKETGDA